MVDSFILGLSSGSACLLTCGMVMFPYLMSGQAGTRKIIADITFFLLSRFIVYGILVTLAFYSGKTLFSSPVFSNYISGVLYILFSVMLIWYSINRNRRPDCPLPAIEAIQERKFIPVVLGIVNSLGLCPALLLMLAKSSVQVSLPQSYLAFLGFFAGSSLYFLPIPLAGKIRRKKVFETVGILATGLAGIIFIIKGISNIIGGIING